MENQLLDLVVKHEAKEIENEKKLMLEKMFYNKKNLTVLKNSFLTEIISCTEPLIDNTQLSNTLEDIKSKINSTSIELNSSIKSLSIIDQSRCAYECISKKGALFYMILYRLKAIDPLYQFSIDLFMKLFLNSINSAEQDQIVLNRISNIIDQLTKTVLEFSCINLFEKHNILFLFQMAYALDKDTGNLSDSELMFFINNDKSCKKINIKNPTTWLSNKCWQYVVNLSKNFIHFSNLIEHICSHVEDWKNVSYLCFTYFYLLSGINQ